MYDFLDQHWLHPYQSRWRMYTFTQLTSHQKSEIRDLFSVFEYDVLHIYEGTSPSLIASTSGVCLLSPSLVDDFKTPVKSNGSKNSNSNSSPFFHMDHESSLDITSTNSTDCETDVLLFIHSKDLQTVLNALGHFPNARELETLSARMINSTRLALNRFGDGHYTSDNNENANQPSSASASRADRLILQTANMLEEGPINFKEFCSVLATRLTKLTLKQHVIESLNYLDQTNTRDGFLTAVEIKILLHHFDHPSLGAALSDSQMNQILATVQFDDTGKISCQAFAILVANALEANRRITSLDADQCSWSKDSHEDVKIAADCNFDLHTECMTCPSPSCSPSLTQDHVKGGKMMNNTTTSNSTLAPFPSVRINSPEHNQQRGFISSPIHLHINTTDEFPLHVPRSLNHDSASSVDDTVNVQDDLSGLLSEVQRVIQTDFIQAIEAPVTPRPDQF